MYISTAIEMRQMSARCVECDNIDSAVRASIGWPLRTGPFFSKQVCTYARSGCCVIVCLVRAIGRMIPPMTKNTTAIAGIATMLPVLPPMLSLLPNGSELELAGVGHSKALGRTGSFCTADLQ